MRRSLEDKLGMSDPLATRAGIERAVAHAKWMREAGQLSEKELNSFMRYAISEAIDRGTPADEMSWLMENGFEDASGRRVTYLDRLREAAGYDDGEDHSAADKARQAVATKVVANFVSDPMVRETVTTDGAVDELKKYGFDVSGGDDGIDEVYLRSSEADGEIVPAIDEATERQLQEIGDPTSAVYHGGKPLEIDGVRAKPMMDDWDRQEHIRNMSSVDEYIEFLNGDDDQGDTE